MTVDCPYCEKAFESKRQTAQHAFTSGDSKHKGVNFQKAMMQLEAGGAATPDSRASEQRDEPEDDDVQEDAGDDGTENPAFDGEPQDAQRQGDNPACPNGCGDLHHVNEIDRARYRVENGDTEYVCLDCGGEFKDD